MTLLNTADSVYVGDISADTVYLGDTLVWSKGPLTYKKRIKSLYPLSYWRLGEAVYGAGAVDEMGLYGCAWTGNPTLGVPGLLRDDADTAMQVHGVINQGASAGNPPDYQLQTLTLEAWIQTSNAGAAYRGIIVKQDGYGMFAVDNVLSVYEWASGQAISSGINIGDGKRHHVVVVFQPSGSQLYADGVPVGPAFNHTTQSHSYPLTIGYATFSGQEFSGIIDEVAIYNRALTAVEVAGNYEVGATWSPAAIPGLAAWFDPAQDIYVDGERITSYREHSSNQRVFAGLSPGVEPVFRAGGAPYIEFQGSGHFQYDTWNAGPVGLTFVAVNSLTTPASPMMLVVHHTSNDGYEMRWDSMQMQTAASWQTAFNYHVHSVADQQDVKQVHMFRHDVSRQTSDAWVGAVRESFGASVMPNVPSYLFIGVRYGGYWYTGKMFEALVFEGAVSDADLDKLRDYLMTKHGL